MEESINIVFDDANKILNEVYLIIFIYISYNINMLTMFLNEVDF